MSHPRGFTLLEMLIATALSTVLMIGVLAVVADLGAPEHIALLSADSAAFESDSKTALGTSAMDRIIDLLREDLLHCSKVDAAGANELTLMGYAALDVTARERSHRPVRLTYAIEEIEGRQWLVRRQEALDVRTNQNVQRDLVCSGITRFELAVRMGQLPAASLPDHSKTNQPPQDEAGPAASETTNVESSANEQEESFLYDGVMLYRRYLPPGVLPQMTAGSRTGATGASVTEDFASKDSDPMLPDRRGLAWRLRVWMDDQRAPAHDRIVAIQWIGGP